ncbi:hypothetical protein C8R47DRAFT_1069457 [Mycena vitilis]|nr:hypothetical protein C8R47DRAFT_1069457 [Mycena vitilis]
MSRPATRPAPLYSAIRPSPIYASPSAYTQSAPNLRRYAIKTQKVPEDVDSLCTTISFVNPEERERYLSEPVSFLQFVQEKESVYHSPVRSRYGSLASPLMERIPYVQPVSSSIENSVVHSAYQTTTPPLSPVIADAHPAGRGYDYLRPPFIEYTREERTAKDLETEHAYIQFLTHTAPALSMFPFKRTVKAIIRDPDGQHFEVHRRPYELLEPGMRVVCFGDMVGEWFTTGEMRQQAGYVMWKWVNHETRYCTIVRVAIRFVRPLTWVERAKEHAKKDINSSEITGRGKDLPSCRLAEQDHGERTGAHFRIRVPTCKTSDQRPNPRRHQRELFLCVTTARLAGNVAIKKSVATKWEKDPESVVRESAMEENNRPVIEQGMTMQNGWSTFGNVLSLTVGSNKG